VLIGFPSRERVTVKGTKVLERIDGVDLELSQIFSAENDGRLGQFSSDSAQMLA
jgi:hypothetical protein